MRIVVNLPQNFVVVKRTAFYGSKQMQ